MTMTDASGVITEDHARITRLPAAPGKFARSQEMADSPPPGRILARSEGLRALGIPRIARRLPERPRLGSGMRPV
jgi:hypothetical protein